MDPITVETLLPVVGGSLVSGAAQTEIGGVFTDSRAGAHPPAPLFVPLKGERFDGHDFIPALAQDGRAAGALVARGLGEGLRERTAGRAGFVLVEVESPLAALQRLAAWNRSRYALPVVGVTGSVGKTTTKEMLGAVAGLEMPAVVSAASFNNHIGVPLTLLRIDASTRLCVAEMGMNDAGELAALSRLVRPTLAVVTNVGPCHLEKLGSLEGVAKAKAEIVTGMERDGVLVLNGDDPYVMKVVRGAAGEREVLTFGRLHQSDFRIEPMDAQEGWNRFRIVSDRLPEPAVIRIPLPGLHNAMNAAAAFVALWRLGVDPERIVENFGRVHGAKMRWEVMHVEDRTVILDCYNANPLSVEAALGTLAENFSGGRRVFVFGNMYELGEQQERLHEAVGPWILRAGVKLTVCVGDLAAHTGRWLLDNGQPAERVVFCADNSEAAFALDRFSRSGDAVLIKGSRRNRMEEIVQSWRQGRDRRKEPVQ